MSNATTTTYPFLDDFLVAKGVERPAFDALKPDSQDFRLLMFQPRGDVIVSDDHFGCLDRSFVERYQAFLSLAKTTNADLVLTPEYSCPWEVLSTAASRGDLPNAGKLWVLGCESITLESLRSLQKESTTLKILYDTALHDAGTGSYLDPVCLVFRSPEGTCVVVVQAKCQHMSEYPERFENIIHGKSIYVVRNDVNSIYLATIICSDALGFKVDALPQFAHLPYIILHPQLNPDPRHTTFAQYRLDTFGIDPNNKEIICLNWAEGTKAKKPASGAAVGIKAPHSAFYSKWPKLLLEDNRLHTNHQRGLYYCNWDSAHATAYVLNYDEHCFELISSKPSAGFARAMTFARRGPSCEHTYVWQGTAWQSGATPDDLTVANLTSYDLNTYPFLVALDKLELERFICLSVGDVSGTDWFQPRALPALRICRDEIVSRASYDRDYRSTLSPQRKDKVRTLLLIFTNGTLLATECGGRLAGKAVHYDPSSRDKNVFLNGQPYGTAAFLGLCGSAEQRRKQIAQVKSIFGDFGGMRLFVWYYDGPDLKCSFDTNLPDITDPIDDPRDFATGMERPQ